MFRSLPPLDSPDDVLVALGESMRARRLPGAPAPATRDNPDLPAGYTYLGQFVDHDITFDPGSHLDRQNDPDSLHSFRTPRFDLDSLYGSGTADSPFLYDQEDPVKLLVGRNQAPIHLPDDLPRNQQGRALIGDPRNDVHVIIAQLHLAFIRFHNAAVDHLRTRFTPPDDLLAEASRLTRWHYQWVVVHDYVRRVVGSELLDQVLVADPSTGRSSPALRFFQWKRQPFIPVEFSAAAYRFGHSQVRPGYQLNETLETLPMLPEPRVPHPLQHLGGFRPLPKNWTVQWDRFLHIGGSSPQLSAMIGTTISDPLAHLPENVDGQRRSLALLNLLRGKALGLPSGQAVAAAMGTTVPDDTLGLDGPTPLWFYLLREAEVIAGGRRLGPTAGRIVAEVLVGLLEADPSSFVRVAPAWGPELPAEQPGQFTLVDFLRFAGVAP
jgi:hypothetical protein